MLKSGCHAERARLRTADRLVNLLAVRCVVGWRVFWLTMANRASPAAPPEVAFAPAEIAVLDQVAGGSTVASERTVAHYLLAVAKLGGYLARTKDPRPATWSSGVALPGSPTSYSVPNCSRPVVGNCKRRRLHTKYHSNRPRYRANVGPIARTCSSVIRLPSDPTEVCLCPA